MMFALAAKIFGDLVSHLEPFEMDDADEFITLFPDLALLKF